MKNDFKNIYNQYKTIIDESLAKRIQKTSAKDIEDGIDMNVTSVLSEEEIIKYCLKFGENHTEGNIEYHTIPIFQKDWITLSTIYDRRTHFFKYIEFETKEKDLSYEEIPLNTKVRLKVYLKKHFGEFPKINESLINKIKKTRPKDFEDMADEQIPLIKIKKIEQKLINIVKEHPTEIIGRDRFDYKITSPKIYDELKIFKPKDKKWWWTSIEGVSYFKGKLHYICCSHNHFPTSDDLMATEEESESNHELYFGITEEDMLKKTEKIYEIINRNVKMQENFEKKLKEIASEIGLDYNKEEDLEIILKVYFKKRDKKKKR